jgi:hypothetical protein
MRYVVLPFFAGAAFFALFCYSWQDVLGILVFLACSLVILVGLLYKTIPDKENVLVKED